MGQIFGCWLNDLFRRHNGDAVRFAARLVGDRDNGEEVVQEAWLNLAARTATAPIVHSKTYLFTATRNAAIDFIMRRQREWSRRVDIQSLTDSDLGDDAVKRYEERRQLARLSVFLNELPAPCRKAFVLNKFEGYSHAEIALKLGISVSMVEKHIIRALLHCRYLTQADDNR